MLLVLIIVLVARGCSKSSDTVIKAKAFSTGTTIDLPLSAELNESDFVSYGGYQFTTKKTLSALNKLITKNNEGVTAATYTNSYGECGVYTKPNESGGTDTWCLYVKDPKNTNEKWYFFMGEHREIALDSGTLDMLLPLHLITDASLRDTHVCHRSRPGTAVYLRSPTSCPTGRRSPACSAHSTKIPVSIPSRPATRALRSSRAAVRRN